MLINRIQNITEAKNSYLSANNQSQVNINGAKFSFGHGSKPAGENDEIPSQLKRGVLISTVAAVGLASALIAKKQGFSLNPKVIFSQNPKNWAIFKIFNKHDKNAKLMEIEEKEILILAGASAAGGLAGGAVFDEKKHFKGKVRETVNQLLGNVAVPVACVSAVAHLYDKNKAKILSNVPQAPGLGKKTAIFNKLLKALPSAAMTIAALGAGIVGGNKLSNFINDKVYHKKVERKIKTTDFAPHVDDISMAVTLMADKSALSTAITRTVPAFLCVPGYQIGTHRG